MVDTDWLREVGPHYAAILLLTLVAVGVARTVLADVNLLMELLIVFAVFAAYRVVVGYFGYLPRSWTER